MTTTMTTPTTSAPAISTTISSSSSSGRAEEKDAKEVSDEGTPDDDEKETEDLLEEDPLQLAARNFCKAAAAEQLLSSTDKFQVFAKRWKLKSESLEALTALPEDEADAIMKDYMPPRHTADVDMNFKAYLRKRQGIAEPTVASGLDEFCSRWREEILQGVIKDFEPPPGTFDLSSAVRDFAERRRFPDVKTEKVSSQSSRHRGHQKWKHRGDVSSEIREFTERWGLDDQCAVTLSRSSKEIQWHAIHNFAPRSEAKNPSSKFMAWLRFQQQNEQEKLQKGERLSTTLHIPRKRKRSHHR
eukprot:CAMPEP_0206574286 /NCGR_PEP_ID=MMETSP0325_2-20121206/29354_1 /ASSEMBLY_ACC=CAM_ASM_000347 /TAXON_ID=2866 /ORGANISM="Crypthecodinium cohnii, Strain Seligo" /LENGTH=299 /DNA_ID=CAMNT_0054078859 /DNA_START=355 /DNA_END=1254 /DNA_ORIENTATION=-